MPRARRLGAAEDTDYHMLGRTSGGQPPAYDDVIEAKRIAATEILGTAKHLAFIRIENFDLSLLAQRHCIGVKRAFFFEKSDSRRRRLGVENFIEEILGHHTWRHWCVRRAAVCADGAGIVHLVPEVAVEIANERDLVGAAESLLHPCLEGNDLLLQNPAIPVFGVGKIAAVLERLSTGVEYWL